VAGIVDDLGHPYVGSRPAARVVSLVPSLTEALASANRGALVGVTDWCTHPRDLSTRRVRGTKNPNLSTIRDLKPDVVVANKEENRELDVRRLRDAGIPVWVTDIRTAPDAIASMSRMFDGLGWDQPSWLAEAGAFWTSRIPPITRKVAVAVWRDPWMVVGSDTFTGDLIRRLGWQNVYESASDRYPTVTLAELDASGADVILLPDEPYAFTATDGPSDFKRTPTELIAGRLITWYGPSLLAATHLCA
jgi:ABC-type Fe3+-hydroxamate transport system substrate-binding protein